MSRIGRTLVGCALGLVTLAGPAQAAFVEVARIDSGAGSGSLALSSAADGSFVSQFRDVVPAGPDGFTHANYLSMDAGGAMYVTDGGSETVRKLDASGAPVTTFGASGDGKLSRPAGTALDPAGNLYVADSGNARIAVFKPDGTFVTSIGKGIVDGAVDVAVDTAGNVYVLDNVNTDVVKL